MTRADETYQHADDLPVQAIASDMIVASRSSNVVMAAPPGSGKTSVIPLALLDDLPESTHLSLIQPRRMAARSVAHHIARLHGSPISVEVDYQVRFDSKVSTTTRLFVETTGIMLRRIMTDPTLDGIGAVILDEFHERSVEMDLLLGILFQTQQTVRPDLRIVVMSATLDTSKVASFLGTNGEPCPVFKSDGRLHPVQIRFQPSPHGKSLSEQVLAAVGQALQKTNGHLLVFLPGVGEIVHCEHILTENLRQQHRVLKLFGDMPPEEQDRVFADTGCRKIILATNIAETSLTIPGITAVIDSGFARQAHTSASTGIPRLERVKISQSSAHQRAGRAGRTGPGKCWRLWSEASHRDRLTHTIPEVLRGDLTQALLQLFVLGEHRDFPWLDTPPPEAIRQSEALLQQLGAVELPSSTQAAQSQPRITPLGVALSRFPTHPRLARLLHAGALNGVLNEASLVAAMLSERDPFRANKHAQNKTRDQQAMRTKSDIVDRVSALQAFQTQNVTSVNGYELHKGVARRVVRASEQLSKLASQTKGPRASDPETTLMRVLWEAFPDRLARLRRGSDDRAMMVGGRSVRLSKESRVRGHEFFLAIDITDDRTDARVHQASVVEMNWLDEEPLVSTPLQSSNIKSRDELYFSSPHQRVEARKRLFWNDLVLQETPLPVTDVESARELLIGEAIKQFRQILPSADTKAGVLIQRARWLSMRMPDEGLPALHDESLMRLIPALCEGCLSLKHIQHADWLAHIQAWVGLENLAQIDRLAPERISVSNGKNYRIQYHDTEDPSVAIRIQELFGVCETPRICGNRVPLVIHILGPNHRPQQITKDLASFWKTTYPRIQKELRRRYPKHAWPDNPHAIKKNRSKRNKTIRDDKL